MKVLVIFLLAGFFSMTAYAAQESSDYHKWTEFCGKTQDQHKVKACAKVDELCEMQGHSSEACISARRSVTETTSSYTDDEIK